MSEERDGAMKETNGYYNGHYWSWLPEYGAYLCSDLPTQVCAETMEDLHRAMSRQIDDILRERNISLEQYIDSLGDYLETTGA